MIKRYRIYGIVQGVGFRPFIKRLADSYEIKGIVCNYGPFVEVVAKGDEETLAAFRQAVVSEAPERAAIIKVEEFEIENDITEYENSACLSSCYSEMDSNGSSCESINFAEFTIVESSETEGEIFIPPDLAICDECKKELLDPADRRFHHPFINCTQCGPRLTIIENLPYDRERTGMKMFPMCKKCEAEYTDKASRRMDAQPVCCNECGPEYYMLYEKSTDSESGQEQLPRGDEALQTIAGILKSGGVAAVKGIGGFHLACNAKDNDAVMTLRSRKKRPVKPLAVMMRDIETVKKYCILSSAQESELKSPAAPIVLLEKKNDGGSLAEDVAPGNPALGVMLPYAPVQILLFEYSGLEAMVMTSGNISGSPICSTDEEVLGVLSGFTDGILSNSRPILTRADDSVMDFLDGMPYMIRRSRGFAPLPVRVELGTDDIDNAAGYYNGQADISVVAKSDSNKNIGTEDDKRIKNRKTVLAIGGELKNTFCIGVGNLFYPSSFIGDLSDIRASEVLEETVYRFEDMLQIPERRPDVIVCDLHPDYQSVRLAEKLAAQSGAKLVKLQHHYAHVLSCMAENDYMNRTIGISFDGTGFGEDGSIWGGEIMVCDARGFERKSHITPFMHIGGDTASKEGWRIAVSMLRDICVHDTEMEPYDDSVKRIFETHVESGVLSANELAMQIQMVKKGIGAVISTSAGRLFDAVSAVLGICCKSSFEGETAMALEFAAERYADRDKVLSEYTGFKEKYSPVNRSFNTESLLTKDKASSLSAGNIHTAWIFENICKGLLDGLSADMLAYAFHDMLAEETAKVTSAISDGSAISTAALSGGCFQNRLFTKLLKEKLEGNGMDVLMHSMIPANDGGLALGQAVAGMMLDK